MALPATHIRFALDMAHRFPIRHMDRYIAGSLYPDSRWLTGIDRLQSHAARYLEADFANSEYTYGIHIHCVCDKIQSQVFEAGLPGLEGLADSARWVLISAAKMVQDRFDMQAFDLQACLPFLAYAENPNQEDVGRVKTFNQIIQNAYLNKNTLDFQDYYMLWVQVSLSADTAAEMVRKMKKMTGDDEMVYFIKQVYTEMLNRIG